VIKKSALQNIVLLILALMAFSCSHKEKAIARHSVTEKYPSPALHKDLDQLVSIIKKNHPAVYNFTDQKDFDQFVKQQSDKITDSMTITAFYQIVTPIITKIGCGHARTNLPEWLQNDNVTTFLPFQLFFENEKGYLISENNVEDQITAGDEIISIDGKTIPSLLKTFGTFISTDGDNASTKKAVLNSKWFNKFLAIEENFPKNYTITYRHAGNGSTQTTTIASLYTAFNFVTGKRGNSLLQFSEDSAKRSAMITIKSFSFYDKVDSFKRFIDSCFIQVSHAKIKNLILDLRGNTGGDPFCSSYLLSYLVQRPVPYYGQSYPGYEMLAKELPLPQNHFTGNLYTLIDGFCFSSTGHLTALMKYYHTGEFIGTETGGTFTCNDNSKLFVLTNTGIAIRVPTQTYSVAVHGLPRFRGILPDHYAENNLKDELSGIDKVKQVALETIKTESAH
jgi:C-terminal processing protease CtpA/Prc